MKWADDRGGKPKWEDPPEWEAADKALTALAELERTHFTSEDVADASAQGFRDGVASVTQQEPVAWRDPSNSEPGQGCTYDKDVAAKWPHIYKQPLFAAPVAQQHVPEADCGNIDWKDMYEKQKRRAEMWIAKYEADIGPLEKAGPVAQQPQAEAVPVRIYDYVWPQNEHFKNECVYACSYTPAGPLLDGKLFAVVHPSQIPNSYLQREDKATKTCTVVQQSQAEAVPLLTKDFPAVQQARAVVQRQADRYRDLMMDDAAPQQAEVVKWRHSNPLFNDFGVLVAYGRPDANQPKAEVVPPGNLIDLGSVVSFAVDRWLAEVSNRPLVNKNRRTLDDTWRQVIRRFGGDPDALLGPDHDTLLDAAPKGQP